MNAIANTSRDALAKISLPLRKSLADEIELVLLRAHKRGVHDMSMREVQQDLEQALERRVDLSTISARVNDLVAAKRMVRSDKARVCNKSGASIYPLHIVGAQGRLFTA